MHVAPSPPRRGYSRLFWVRAFWAFALSLGWSLAGCATGSATRPCTQATMTPATTGSPPADDPTRTDPDHYRVILENDRVRVLRYHDTPGTKTHQHHHPDSVLYALSAFKRKLVFPDGTTREREFAPGDVMWVPAQTHVGENIGSTESEVLLVEPKRP